MPSTFRSYIFVDGKQEALEELRLRLAEEDVSYRADPSGKLRLAVENADWEAFDEDLEAVSFSFPKERFDLEFHSASPGAYRCVWSHVENGVEITDKEDTQLLVETER